MTVANWIALGVVAINLVVMLTTYSLRATLNQRHAEMRNELLQLRMTIDRDFREEFASRESVDQLRERIDLSDQMKRGFESVHKHLDNHTIVRAS